jgi:hypothetical protein
MITYLLKLTALIFDACFPPPASQGERIIPKGLLYVKMQVSLFSKQRQNASREAGISVHDKKVNKNRKI